MLLPGDALNAPILEGKTEIANDIAQLPRASSSVKELKSRKFDSVDPLTDNEHTGNIRDYLENDLYTDISSPLKGRIKKAPKRVLQHMSYAKLVEDRIVDLENRLGGLEVKVLDKPPFSGADEDGSDKTGAILVLNRVNFEEYKPKKQSFRSIPNPYSVHSRDDLQETSRPHLIDVVVDGTNDSSKDNSAAARIIREAGLTNTSNQVSEIVPDISAPYKTPGRIRINSALLLELLEKITGHSFTPTVLVEGSVTESQVFLRPFKLLVVYENEIRSFARRLAENSNTDQIPTIRTNGVPSEISDATVVDDVIGRYKASASSDNRSVVPAQLLTRAKTKQIEEKNRLESKRCLEELQVLLELFDKDLKPTLDLRHQISEGSLRTIAFPDLWHLFRHGDDICPDEVNFQVYRILNVGGGRPPLMSREDASMMQADSASSVVKDTVTFTISCFYYICNGKDLGSVQKTWEIKQYDGVKPITSLLVYPAKFSPDQNGGLGREGLISCGKRYCKLIRNTSDVVHKRYDGLTLGLELLREEVRLNR